MDKPRAFVRGDKVPLGPGDHASTPNRFVGKSSDFYIYERLEDCPPVGSLPWEREQRTTVTTPVGEVSWTGALTPESDVTLPSGRTISLQTWIGRTNGACLEWLEDYL